ncbi:MAG TPA: hypothetical protein VNK44_08665 [Candidatus Nitrosotenuis sp.]|nr:hypothetical protein [Candidatus Nitrosotenuis sp.]
MKSFETHGLERDLDKVRQLSALVKRRILESNPKYERKIQNLTEQELVDLDYVLGLAEQIMLKYQHKKEAQTLLKEFVDLIGNWASSLHEINDEIQELLISAQSSVSEIKTAQNDVTSNFSFGETKRQPHENSKEGTINLTKSATPVYTQEYQQKSKIQYEQVV